MSGGFWLRSLLLFTLATTFASACGDTESTPPKAQAGASGSGQAGKAGAPSSLAGSDSSAEAGSAAGGSAAGTQVGAGGQQATGGADSAMGGDSAALGGAAEAGSGSGLAGAAGSCPVGCTTEPSNFCDSAQVTWVCDTGFDYDLFNSNCTDAFTNAIRYCCPKSFRAQCQ